MYLWNIWCCLKPDNYGNTDVIAKSFTYPNFEEEELFQEIRQKSFSSKQMPWEPSKIKDFNEVLERNEYR